MNNWGRFEAVEGRHCSSHADGASGVAGLLMGVDGVRVPLLKYEEAYQDIADGSTAEGSIGTGTGQQQGLLVAEGEIVLVAERPLGSRPRNGR